MIKAPWILPDAKSIFWALLGLCIFIMTLTVSYLLLTGKVGSFQAGSDGFSIDLTKTEVALKLASDNEDNLQIIQGLLERERWHKSKIEKLEAQVRSSITLPFASVPTGPEIALEAPKIKINNKPLEPDKIGNILTSKTEEIKETKMRLEIQKELQGRINQQQQQQVPQQQQQWAAPIK